MPLICSGSWKKFVQLFVDSPMASILGELAVRFCLVVAFLYAEFSVAETHVIQREDMWRYRYPYVESRVPFGDLCITILVCAAVVFYWFGINKKFHGYSEYFPAILGFTCSVFLTAVITNFVKSFVGRPRPNYLTRCYGPEDYLKVTDPSVPCIPSNDHMGDLRKSFPSGHSSTAFSGFGYLTLYIAGKLGTFNSKGRGCMWRLVVPFLPSWAAVWVAATRLTDYHHHYDDILTGSLLGAVIAYISYRRYYPSLGDEFCHYPYKWLDLGILSHEQPHGSNSRTPKRMNSGGVVGTSNDYSEQPFLSDEYYTSQNGQRAHQHTLPKQDRNVNITVYIDKLPSNVQNNPHIASSPKCTVDFCLDSKNFDESGTPLVTQDDLNALRQQMHAALADLDCTGIKKLDSH